MNEKTLIQYALLEGFSSAAVIPTEEIIFNPEFRKFCEENLCGQYGANYSCPPDCGTPQEMKDRICSHRYALVLQSSWDISDYNDVAALIAAKKEHNKWEVLLAQRLRVEGCEGFTVGASGCALCSPCAVQKGEPCRYPDQRYSCMSAYCIAVKELAEMCGMDYTWKAEKLSYYSMYVFD